MRRKLWTGIAAAIGLLILILDAKTAFFGASQGLALCIRTVIPSLLPFFVLSILLTSTLTGEKLRLLRPLGRLCGISQGAESLLLIGMLGGYPAGAQCVSQAYQDGILKKQDAQRMIAFCNLAGPAFLFGIVAGKFSDPLGPWALWAIHILSAIFVAILLPDKSTAKNILHRTDPLTLPDAMQRSLRIMAGVCGWILLFRVVIAFLERWVLWMLPIPAQVAITGLLELSNGCCELGKISNDGLRFIICSGMLAFGGLCVTMQTVSVAGGLSVKTYLNGKILQLLVSLLLAGLLQGRFLHLPLLFWIMILSAIILVAKILHKKQKRSSFSSPIGV